MAQTTRTELAAQVRRLRKSLEREKAKSAALAKSRKEAFEHRAATAEILKVISKSPSDAQPVFDAIVRRAVRLIRGHSAMVSRVVDGMVHLAALTSTSRAVDAALRKSFPRPLSETSPHTVAIHSRVPYVVPDMERAARSRLKEIARARGYRSMLVVPMLRDGVAIGTISTTRKAPGPFSKHEIDLLKTFADQAVIAIENARLFNETREALDRQTATSEVLKTISRSTFDLNAVLQVLIENATRLAGAHQGFIFRFDGEVARLAFSYNAPVDYTALISANPIRPGRGALVARTLLERRPVHIPDALEDKEFTWHEAQRVGGFRSMLGVPMMREGNLIGVIAIWTNEVRPFTEKQIELVSTFADQAVIAIENVRLFNETKEALERQTATAEILKVIGSSPTDTQPVFEAIVQSGLKLFPDATVGVARPEGDHVNMVAIAHRDLAVAAATKARFPIPLTQEYLHSTAILDARLIDLPDAELAKEGSFAPGVANFLASGNRAMTVMPMLRAGKAIGAISVTRTVAGPLTDKQLALLRIFADQAVIAIENVRLFSETKEALERQTATSDILGVMSSSPTDIRPVLDAVASTAARLCDASDAIIQLKEGDALRFVAHHGALPNLPIGGTRTLSRELVTGRSVLEGRQIHVHDLQAEIAEYPQGSEAARQYGYRTILATPLMREGAATGSIMIRRVEKRPFTDTHLALMRTFADQAAIAIENVRLFNETKEALERQTATAEILKVISATPTDVRPVLDAVASSAARLCEAKDVAITLKEGDQLRYMAHQGEIPTAVQIGQAKRISNDWTAGRAALEGRQVHIRDVLDESEGLGEGARMGKQAGYRTVFATPLLRHGAVIGVIVMRRGEVRPFEHRQIELVNTFADQAVIAIENVRLFNETKEALERQTATAEILKVIASSPSDVQPVFDAIAASARRLLDGHAALVARRAGDVLELAAFTSTGEAGDSELSRLWPSKITGRGHMGKALVSAAPAWVEDIETDPSYSEEFRVGARARGMRSSVSVPMLREGEAIGVISVNRSIPGRFSDHQTNLLRTFADQAVIAIENVRLFNETQEALARQAAAAQVLRSISESVSDTAPVFAAILDCCNRLIPSIDYVQVQLIEGSDRVRLVDHRFGQVRGAAPGKQEERKAELMAREAAHFPRPLAGSTLERALNQGRVVILADTLDGPDTPPGTLVEARRWGHSYSQITVPLMREGRCIGAIEAFRRQLGGFEVKESSLLESFADQAVIAIENVRLFNETKEALERQTATAEILKVISSSPTDTQPVFDAIVNSCARLFDGLNVVLNIVFGNTFDRVAVSDPDKARQGAELFPMPLDNSSVAGRAMLRNELIQIEDLAAEEWIREGTRSFFARSGFCSALCAPMSRDGQAIGSIMVFRASTGRFKEEQVALLRTFSDQAVIAIENVRLFNELQSRTEALGKSVDKLTALGEVGRAISSTLDLEKVLKTIASHAVQLTGLDGASIYEYDEAAEEFRVQVAHNFDPEFLEAIRNAPIRKGDGTVGEVAITLEPAQVTDILEGNYHSSRKELLTRAGYRAVLTVPLLREDHIIGALSVTRKTPGPFGDEIVELLKTFATQSAMAIQNARLFREIHEKGKQLEEASKHKSQFLASMSHELRTPLNAILGFNEMILGDIYGEVPADMKEPLTDIQTSGKHLLRLINNVLDLAKIEAGRMELALDDYSVHDTVEAVRSTLRPLAEAKGLELAVDVPSDIPLAHGDGGRITQCLMNLAGNSLKFTKQGSVGISVALENGTLRYRVTDTGIGIPADKIGSLFTEFKQTDATIASEYGGTGLGLSISKKFIEMHGGRIWAESEPGSGSTFIFEVPLRAGGARDA